VGCGVVGWGVGGGGGAKLRHLSRLNPTRERTCSASKKKSRGKTGEKGQNLLRSFFPYKKRKVSGLVFGLRNSNSPNKMGKALKKLGGGGS